MANRHDEDKKDIAVKGDSLMRRFSGTPGSRKKRSTEEAMSEPDITWAPGPYGNAKIEYPDASVLQRPLDMPRSIRGGLLIFLAIAAAIGGFFLFRYYDATVSAPARAAAEVTENVTRHVPYNFPILLDLMPLSDTEIMDELSSSGDTLFERAPIGTNEAGGFQVIKLPEDVSMADAAAIYLTGIEKVSAVSASRLLNGAWNLTVTREAPYSISLRYADFSSGSIENAIQNALLAENLGIEDEGAQSGVDDSGNTYVSGTILGKDDVRYQWRVSVIALSEVYDIKGMPDDALYVGIRMTETDPV